MAKASKPKEENQDKKKAYEAAIEKLNATYGKGTVITANMKPDVLDVISTGSLGVDIALGVGGAPMGRIIEIIGPESSGKTTMLLHLIANAQKKGILCALIDMEHHLIGSYAKALGVDLDTLILSQPMYGEAGMKVAEELIKSGEVGFVAIDSVAALVPKSEVESGTGDPKMAGIARIMSQGLRVLNPLVEANDVVLAFTNQIRTNPGGMVAEEPTGGKALRFYAGVRLDLRRIRNDRGEELSRTKIKVLKNKVGKPFSEIEVNLQWGKGFDRFQEVMEYAIMYKLIDKGGSWYTVKNLETGEQIHKCQGEVELRKFLEDNSEYGTCLEERVIELLKAEQ